MNASMDFAFPVSEKQKELEKKFCHVVDFKKAYDWTVEMCKVGPKGVNQLMGMPENIKKAEYIAKRLKECGLHTEVQSFECERHDVLECSLTIISPKKVDIPCTPMIYGNATKPEGVSGSLLYVGRGWEEDYKKLERRGIEVKGKIVLMDGFWARSRLILARIHGAVGAIVATRLNYSYFEGPAGGWHRPIRMLPKGSTYAWLEHQEDYMFYKFPEESLPMIPAVTVQRKDGAYLRSLCRREDAKVLIKVIKNVERKQAFNVVATIPGSEFPDEVVMVGAHYDSFGRGVLDNSSGCGVILGVAHAFGELMKEGIRPRRTLKFCFWTGEEEGCVGSYAYLDEHESIKNKIVAYIDVDGGVFGKDLITGGWGSPELGSLSKYVAASVVPGLKAGGYGLVRGAGFDMIVFFIDGCIPVTSPVVTRGGKDWVGKRLTPYLVKSNPYHGPADEPEPERLLRPDRFKEPIEGLGVMLLTLSESDVLPLDYKCYARMLMEGKEGLRDLAKKASKFGINLAGALKELEKMEIEAEKLNRVLTLSLCAYLKATGQGPWEGNLDDRLLREVSRLPKELPNEKTEALRRYFRLANLIRRLVITPELKATCFCIDGAYLYTLPWIQPVRYSRALRSHPEKLHRIEIEAQVLEQTFRRINTIMEDLSMIGERLIYEILPNNGD
ncbi:MAG: M20/M25/M40 family metallo-hydrolase [Candidatus Bathyarchaeia archaeon]